MWSRKKRKQMTDNSEKVGVLFVCMGNICRSPTAEGVFRKVVADAGLDERVAVDSAGTHAYHIGEPADRRAAAAAERRGFSLKGIKARRFSPADLERFVYVLAMDEDNLSILLEHAGEQHREKVRLFLEFSGGEAREVPDPYYGGAAGFEHVLDLVEDAARGLLQEVTRR